LDDALAYVRGHLAIIRRFGRFPHRNAILGRSSRPEEQAFLAQNPESYGQSVERSGRLTGSFHPDHGDRDPAAGTIAGR
jgi:hypothetical protein